MKSRYAISRSDLNHPLCRMRVRGSRRVVDREMGVFEDKETASLGIAIGDIPTVT
jgi:hypothetical protein